MIRLLLVLPTFYCLLKSNTYRMHNEVEAKTGESQIPKGECISFIILCLYPELVWAPVVPVLHYFKQFIFSLTLQYITVLQDKWKCACQQLTIESSAVINGGKPNPFVGYQNRRLMEPTLSG